MEILLVNTGFYPDKDAGSTRVTIFAKMLKELRHHPVVASYSNFDNYSIENIDGIDYVSLIPRMRYFKKSIAELLTKQIVKPDVIWIYWAPLPAFIFLKNYCKKNNIKLVHDSVEWFSAYSLKEKLSYNYLERIITNKYIINRRFNVISISSFLNNYYSNKKIKSIRIPILMDIVKMNCSKKFSNDGKIHLLYAGSPSHGKGKSSKDDLMTIFNALSNLSNETSDKIKFVILGLNNEQILDIYGFDIKKCKVEIEALGRVPRNVVLEKLQDTHFTLLLRDANAIYAKAGFPTKAVESLSTGTPLICNLSSDLNLYLKDFENSIILEKNNVDSLVKAFDRIINLNYNDYLKLSENARKTALDNFYYKLYLKELEEFLKF